MSLFHTHKWKVTGVDQMYSAFRWTKKKEEGDPFSYIHRVCVLCGDAQTKKLTGHYQLKEFAPTDTPVKEI